MQRLRQLLQANPARCALAIGAAALLIAIGAWAVAAQADDQSQAPGKLPPGEASPLPAPRRAPAEIQLCQGCEGPVYEAAACGPGCPTQDVLMGVDSCDRSCCGGEADWANVRPIPWSVFAQGEYVGPARLAHTPEYRLRVDDQLEFIYRLTRVETSTPYQLNVGDEIRVESLTDPSVDRLLVIQPDGAVTLRLLGQVQAARKTVDELRELLEEKYKKYYKVPAITVTPIKVNTKLDDLRATVDSRAGQGGQSQPARVSPDGTVQLPGLGSIPAQGLTMQELKREIDQRYADLVDGGIEITPTLVQRAPRYIYVLGEVRNPGRYTLEGPTTAMQAIALAGGWNNGGNLREIVCFRRGDDWRLMATRMDLRGALYGYRPAPSDELWLRDADIIVVPKSPLLIADEFIELFFTRGVYGVVPFQGINIGFSKLGTI